MTSTTPTEPEALTYQSAADCPLGSAHGMASTHGNADDVTCCDFCGFPVDDDDCPIVADGWMQDGSWQP